MTEQLLPSSVGSSLVLMPPVFPFSQTFFLPRDQAPGPLSLGLNPGPDAPRYDSMLFRLQGVTQ